jgi:hypothetical protein
MKRQNQPTIRSKQSSSSRLKLSRLPHYLPRRNPRRVLF